MENLVVIDGRGHLMGRLASTVAKEILRGQRVVVVRCEEIDISGAIWRNKLKYQLFINKRTNTNPKKGPIHYHSPCKMFWRVVRGMVPHKTWRGTQALLRFKAFDGVPAPYDCVKRMSVPDALRVLRLNKGRRFTNLGDLALKFGWKYQEALKVLEDKRKAKSKVYHENKIAKKELKEKAKDAAFKKLAPELQAALTEFGY